MKKIKATYIGPADNRWGLTRERAYYLNVYSRGGDRVWAALTDESMTSTVQPSPLSWPDIMDFLTNWHDIQTYEP